MCCFSAGYDERKMYFKDLGGTLSRIFLGISLSDQHIIILKILYI